MISASLKLICLTEIFICKIGKLLVETWVINGIDVFNDEEFLEIPKYEVLICRVANPGASSLVILFMFERKIEENSANSKMVATKEWL